MAVRAIIEKTSGIVSGCGKCIAILCLGNFIGQDIAATSPVVD